MTDSAPLAAVVIATRDRAALLVRLLRSLDLTQSVLPGPIECVVVDNGSTDATAQVLSEWARASSGHITLRVDEPGKSRALNRALQHVHAPLIVFTDDDVEVTPEWLHEIVVFFADHQEYAGAMGRVRIPPEVTDPKVLAAVKRYRRVVPLFDLGDQVCDAPDLWGCNMAVRRAALQRVGPFDKRLGPGASGLSEDVDLSRRLRQAGLRIGYMPRAIVYHQVDTDRLTHAYYRELQRRAARGEFLMHPDRSSWRSLFRLLEAASVGLGWTLIGASQRRRRAWDRAAYHRMLLRCHWEAYLGHSASTHPPAPGGSAA